MTGLTETEHVLAGFAAGGIDYVTKPIQPVEVLARIAAHVRSAQGATRARDAIDAAGGGLVVMDAGGTPSFEHGRRPMAGGILRPGRDRSRASGRHAGMGARSGGDRQRRASGWGEPARRVRGERRLVVTYAGAVSGGFLFKLEVVRLEPETVPLADAFNLTPRELEVLLWVSRGKTNRDIGDILGLSPRTVNKHLEHIYEKLGVETRTAAAGLAMRAASGSNTPRTLSESG